MFNESSFDAFVETVAEKIANKVTAKIQQNGDGTKVAPRLLTVQQAAKYLGRTTDAVRHMVDARKLPTVRDGRRVFLDIQELDRWILQNTELAED